MLTAGSTGATFVAGITFLGRIKGVQTPTLAILTQRELEIQAFEPEPYSEVWAEFDVQSGSYSGRWIDRDWKKNDHPHSRAERIWDPEQAAVIHDLFQMMKGSKR